MTANKIRVVVVGAKGRMGRETVKAVLNDPELELVGCIDRTLQDVAVSALLGHEANGVKFSTDLSKTLLETNADVMVDFTTPATMKGNIDKAIELGVRPVVGTTGMTPEEIANWNQLCKDRGIGGLIAPNFAIGAILMMRFAQQAARYLPHVEIIEMHHDQKLDAPSGTAIKTLELIALEREAMQQGHPDEQETIAGSRGGDYEGMRVHSVRLPGYVAHQQVIFGGLGQTLTIRHDSINRESFMPGVVMGCKQVMKYEGLVYGLENLLD
ncbi:4-hydroxy-tetrahydrodipicolinate reductase [Tumebacillus permanentifrigoris]|uniref:4-hydroxy-tetrahydrodipicolinate reductase n=1 Tax=Tumebacillus permanentifrigoris TaxID=378543 RepID=A0A316DEE8_9BACL|nr:4-hydroxy-tetrahydrodipicolinate reductase [Tumebacillus permanentifrigoris]PWK15549.1 dihydrodipicolinate reductase [Tumebacillus permanentifrigoris]